MFGVGPAYLFLAAAPAAGRPDARRLAALGSAPWRPISRSPLIAATLIWLIGIKAFLLVHLPIIAARRLGRRLAVLRAAPVRAHDLGPRRRAGTCTRPPCTAARITICRRCCAGSRPISACTTCITSAAAFPITGCRACCATTRNCAARAAAGNRQYDYRGDARGGYRCWP